MKKYIAMKKNIAATGILCVLLLLLLFACNEDSSKGILQRVYSSTATESSYNQRYLGMDEDNGYVYLVRDNDVYRAASVYDSKDSNYDLKYTKLFELSTTSNNFLTIGYSDGNIYFATMESGTVRFFYASVDDITDAVTLRDVYESYSTVSFGSDLTVTALSVARLSTDEIQFLFTADGTSYYASTTPSNLTTSGISFSDDPVEVPENAEIVGSKSLRVRTEDPELDYDDNLNELYLIEDNELKKVYVHLSDPDYFACGTDTISDTKYAAFMNGYIYKLEESDRSGYAYERGDKAASFSEYERNNNLLVTYDDGNNIVGYFYDTGVYLRVDYGSPVVRSITDDANVFPLCILGHRTNSSGYTEYLMLTQNNGFFVIEPYYHLKTSRSYITKVDNSSSSYNIADYLSGDEDE